MQAKTAGTDAKNRDFRLDESLDWVAELE